MTKEFAPPCFSHLSKRVVPIHIHSLTVNLNADVDTRTLHCEASMRFSQFEDGYPMFDLVPSPLSIQLDATMLPLSSLPEIEPPGGEAKVRYLEQSLKANIEYELRISYHLDSYAVQFDASGVRIGFFMNDLVDRGFLERYAPANFEFDQFPILLNISLRNAADKHYLFSNGQITDQSDYAWSIVHPRYFSSSSIYLHLTNRPLSIRRAIFRGNESFIPIEVYSNSGEVADIALAQAISYMEELEQDYGPYAHYKMLIYAADALEPPLGGMEYCGATMTEIQFLGHEVAHSWFGRGIMPSKGSAGWIDEAIVRWRDNGYPRASGPPNRSPINLSDYSPYRRRTTLNPSPYSWGSLLLSEIDYLLRNSGGLRPLLSKLYRDKKNELIDTEIFKSFLMAETGMDLTDIFDRYVYGKSGGDSIALALDTQTSPDSLETALKKAWGTTEMLPSPRPFTQTELQALL